MHKININLLAEVFQQSSRCYILLTTLV